MTLPLTESLRSFIVETFLFGEDDPQLGVEASFLENGIVDSTGVLELVEFVESEFSIRVTDDELIPENFDSIQKLVAYVTRKRPHVQQRT